MINPDELQDTRDAVRAEDKITLGIPSLQERIDGIEKGSIIAVVTDPRIENELLFEQLSNVRQTVFNSSLRGYEDVINTIYDGELPEHVSIVEDYNDAISRWRKQSGSLEEPNNEHIKELLETEGRNVILEGFDYLNKDDQDLFKDRMTEIRKKTNGVEKGHLFLHFTRLDNSELSRYHQACLQLCDVIFEIEVEDSGETTSFIINIRKIRGSPQEQVSLSEESERIEFNEEINRDTSRTVE